MAASRKGKKAAGRKKTAKKKSASKKSSRKKSSQKKSGKKATRKKAARKVSPRKAGRKKTTARKATRSAAASSDVRLSANFSLREFTRSQTASRKGLDNTPPDQALPAIQKLVDEVLQPARTEFAKAMNISSGYRSPELNRAIGGSTRSQHCWKATHAAADIEIFGVDNLSLAYWIQESCEYDQLISECYDPDEGPSSGWVHVSIKTIGTNRKQSLTYQRGEGYTAGLPPR